VRLWSGVRAMVTGAWLGLRSALQSNIADPAKWLIDWLGGGPTSAGVQVSERSALGVAGLFSCVRVVAEDLGSLPLKMHEQLDDGSRRVAPEHQLSEKLEYPNPEMHIGEFVETLTGHALLRGNGYAEIEWTEDGQVANLWPLHPDRVMVRRVDNVLVYVVQLPAGQTSEFGNWKPLRQDQVFHLRGLSSDGVLGLSPLDLHREAIGLGIALEKHGASFFGRGGDPGGVLTTDHELSDVAWGRLTQWLAKRSSQGLDASHRWAILEAGLKWQQVGLRNDQSQFLESRKYQIEDYARIIRVALHKVQHLEHATFSNIEHQGIEYVTDSIRPWAVRWERAIKMRLMRGEERARFYPKFHVDALMRGDQKTRYEGYAVGRQWGWLSADDVCDFEDRNKLPGGQGKFYLVPANMQNAERLLDPPKPPPTPLQLPPAPPAPGENADEQEAVDVEEAARAAFTDVFEGELDRLVRKEGNAIARAVKRVLEPQGLKAFETWSAEFYEAHQLDVRTVLLRQARALGVALGVRPQPEQLDEYAANAARVYTSRAFEELGVTLRATPHDAAAATMALVGRWVETRARELAPAEVGRAAAHVKERAAAAA
jgi:HK97 family phage portal protein